ncbi:GUN4 domain-containing protein [Anabaena sp. AL93]|uniref:GUN4 domain-containing protein n=1 Tax=Anabaena sp. AL93 TaxID=1678133 RepID=UPI000A7443D5
MADNTNNHQSILNASVGDQASENDYLGFEPYVVAIAEFLTNPETKPPLTLSIEGEWGSGKSSFMKQLEKAIQETEKKKFDDEINQEKKELKEYLEKFNQKKVQNKILSLSSLLNNLLKWLKLKLKIITFRPPTTVWFNAWRHDKAEALWAAFSLEFLRQISQIRHKRDVLPILKGNIRLSFLRFNWIQGIYYLFLVVVGLLVLIASVVYAIRVENNVLKVVKNLKEIKEFITFIFQPELELPRLITRVIIYVSPFIGFVSLVLKIFNIGNPKNDLNNYLKSPKYENQIEFIEEFHADFKKIVEAFSGQNKVYVFIDDLDRCEITKSAELMQAINMMIANDPQLIFILGMDVDKVAAGIAVKYKEIIPYLGFDANSRNNRSLSIRAIEYGYNFFEKFVQIRFQIPQPTTSDFARFLNKISPRKTPPQPKIVNNTEQIEAPGEEIAATGTLPSTSEEQRDRIENIRITTGEDSEVVRNIALMVAPALDYNPRRWKQFINVFRLKAYIGASTNLITAHVSENNSRRYLTLEQLGKFTAISIRWPRLIMDLNTDRQLLKHLQKGALEHSADFSEYNETTKYWGSKPKLVELLRYAAVGSIEKYSFANVDVETLLQVSPTDDLSSERDIDYTKLRDLLKAGNWKEADKETYEVMIKAVGKKSGEWFTDNELLNFPCQDLRTIDKLWVKYSERRFGFSVQKEIYLSVGGKADGEYHRDAWEKFGNKVGWRENEGWIYYSQVKFSTSAVDGHLPFYLVQFSLDDWTLPSGLGRFCVLIFSRIETCKL